MKPETGMLCMTCAAAQATTGNRLRPSGGVFSGGSGWDLTTAVDYEARLEFVS
jgi:hypothetical protein